MSKPKEPYQLMIVAPTCFYYHAPLFRSLAANPRFDLKVYFCSDEPIHAQDIQQMYHSDGRWGQEEDLLSGFESQFLRNYSPLPSYLTWPFGLANIGIWNKIRRQRPHAVILMSWMNVTWWLVIVACLLHRVPFIYLTDANVLGTQSGAKWKRWIKKFLLGKIIFPRAAGFLCAGTANWELYRYFGVPEEKLVSFAYFWGYESFSANAPELKQCKAHLRSELGIPEEADVILFCGRLSPEKNLFHLLKAYEEAESKNKALLFVGGGELQDSLEQFVEEHNLKSVYFAGFQNRTELPKYFALSDLLVLPSQRETWGMVVAEALSFGVPVIVSDQVGAGRDLVQQGYNGFVFPVGDVAQLTEQLDHFLGMAPEARRLLEKHSEDTMTWYASRDFFGSMEKYFDSVYSGDLASHAK